MDCPQLSGSNLIEKFNEIYHEKRRASNNATCSYGEATGPGAFGNLQSTICGPPYPSGDRAGNGPRSAACFALVGRGCSGRLHCSHPLCAAGRAQRALHRSPCQCARAAPGSAAVWCCVRGHHLYPLARPACLSSSHCHHDGSDRRPAPRHAHYALLEDQPSPGGHHRGCHGLYAALRSALSLLISAGAACRLGALAGRRPYPLASRGGGSPGRKPHHWHLLALAYRPVISSAWLGSSLCASTCVLLRACVFSISFGSRACQFVHNFLERKVLGLFTLHPTRPHDGNFALMQRIEQ